VVVARGLERAEAVAEEVRGLGREALALQADVTVKTEMDSVVASTLERFGRVDVGINNVGGRAGKPEGLLLDSSPDYWHRTTELSLYSAFYGCHAFARAMVDRGTRGVILNIASTTAYKANPALAPYAAAKAGVIQLTKSLARELAPHGIRVAGIAPGMVNTDSLREFMSPEMIEERGQSVPAGRIAGPDDLGKVAVLMASDLAGWVYGQTLIADGGETLADGA
jgi:3-oxoacyl-[acyl-carrier protein] reductase